MLDRENNDGNYEIGNVRWVTPTVSANNRHQTFGKRLIGERNPMFGKRRPDLSEWNRRNLKGKKRGALSEETKELIRKAKLKWWKERKSA